MFCLKKSLFFIIVQLIVGYANAEDLFNKESCKSAIGSENLDDLKKELLLDAKREAVGEIFGELITALTKVRVGKQI